MQKNPLKIGKPALEPLLVLASELPVTEVDCNSSKMEDFAEIIADIRKSK